MRSQRYSYRVVPLTCLNILGRGSGEPISHGLKTRRLQSEKILNPSNYYFQQTGATLARLDTTRPHDWAGATVVDILENPVYLEHTKHPETRTQQREDSLRYPPLYLSIYFGSPFLPVSTQLKPDIFSRICIHFSFQRLAISV